VAQVLERAREHLEGQELPPEPTKGNLKIKEVSISRHFGRVVIGPKISERLITRAEVIRSHSPFRLSFEAVGGGHFSEICRRRGHPAYHEGARTGMRDPDDLCKMAIKNLMVP
jgi:hypothetical protein